MALSGKRILLVIGGGIAAYKSLDLIRRLRERGASVRCILTAGGAAVRHAARGLRALRGQRATPTCSTARTRPRSAISGLSRDADLIVVAPATADLMAKMAGGHADDLASTVLLATDKPVLIAPAMNVRMWQHPATQRNLATLLGRRRARRRPQRRRDGGGEFGPGRMAEPARDRRRGRDVSLAVSGPLAGTPRARHRGPDPRAHRSGALHRQPLLRQAGPRHRARPRRGRRAR